MTCWIWRVKWKILAGARERNPIRNSGAIAAELLVLRAEGILLLFAVSQKWNPNSLFALTRTTIGRESPLRLTTLRRSLPGRGRPRLHAGMW